MDGPQLERAMQTRTGMERRVYDSLRQHGRLTDRQLRELLGSRGSGPRDALAKLLPTGLVRYAGRAAAPGRPMQYEATPPAQVEAAAERYAVRKPKRQRRRASVGARIRELRGMAPGDFRDWHAARQRILSQTKLLTNVEPMAFWEVVPLDELEMILDEVRELRDWTEGVIAAIAERAEHESVKKKIGKLRATDGRTPQEKETARRLEEKLRRKLIVREK